MIGISFMLIISVEHCGLTRKGKDGTFATTHLCVRLPSAGLLGNYTSFADHHKRCERRRLSAVSC